MIYILEEYLAGINLKILCKTRWSNLYDKFEEPQLTLAERDALKEHIPSALADPNTKIRTLVVRRAFRMEVLSLNPTIQALPSSRRMTPFPHLPSPLDLNFFHPQ